MENERSIDEIMTSQTAILDYSHKKNPNNNISIPFKTRVDFIKDTGTDSEECEICISHDQNYYKVNIIFNSVLGSTYRSGYNNRFQGFKYIDGKLIIDINCTDLNKNEVTIILY